MEEDRATQQILEKAISRGLVNDATVLEARRLHDELAAKGTPRPMVEILGEISGIDPRMFTALDDQSLVGRKLGGFEIAEKIGAGSMGSVFRATQTSLGRTVALKILDPGLGCRPEFAARFRREARAAARLDHPNVVQPIDFGEDAGFLFFAMEFMEGGSAAHRLEKDGTYGEREALVVALAVARALEYAQAHGLVHRDIKPDNILFSKHGTAKLADLGLVLEREGNTQLTEPGLLVGTPAYMAPELARGRRDLDVRSDIYSLGVTIFELVTGKPPFSGPDAFAVLTQHVLDPMPDLRVLAPATSEGFAAIVARMTAKEREGRYASARELSEALEAVAGPALVAKAAAASGGFSTRELREALVAAPPAPLAAPPPEPSAAAAGSAESKGAGRRMSGAKIAIAALAIVAAAASAVLWRTLFRAPRVDPQAETDAAHNLREVLFARRSADGAYGFAFNQPSDPWSSAQALAALVLATNAAPPEHVRAVLERLRALEIAGPDGRPAGWPVLASDNAGCAEVAAWVGIALAIAGDAEHVWSPKNRAEVRRLLLSMEAEGGGFPSIPAAGAATVRTSGTALVLIALAALERALHQAPPFQLAETTFAINLLRARPADDPGAGSLAALLLERRK